MIEGKSCPLSNEVSGQFRCIATLKSVLLSFVFGVHLPAASPTETAVTLGRPHLSVVNLDRAMHQPPNTPTVLRLNWFDKALTGTPLHQSSPSPVDPGEPGHVIDPDRQGYRWLGMYRRRAASLQATQPGLLGVGELLTSHAVRSFVPGKPRVHDRRWFSSCRKLWAECAVWHSINPWQGRPPFCSVDRSF
jgi:hypothetical protein